jgi:hypothetical protein
MIKGTEKLQLTSEQKQRLELSERNYKRFGRIYFQIISFENDTLIVKVWQRENAAEKYLSAPELIERARGVFSSIIPAGAIIHVRPIVFKRDELKLFTVADIETKMKLYGLQAKDLVKLLDIDKSSLSLMLNRERELTKSGRAMFYYLFKSMETNPVSSGKEKSRL